MASPELAITKATLSASLFRADPISLSRPAVEAFFPLLTNTLAQCSRPNVQKCKVWIVDNIVPSSTRSGALGKFLVALSKSLAEEDDKKKRPSSKRRRLHLLYIVNDILFDTIVRRGNRKFAAVWNGVLPALVGSAANFKNCPKHMKKLEDLITLWHEKKYFSAEVVTQLREALANGAADNSRVDLQSSETSLKLAKDAPYILPSFHGDASSPWYDLPAATWLPHLTPNSTKAMVPDRIRPIQLAPGPADKRLTDAVKSLIQDVDRIFSKEKKWDNDPYVDISDLGERVILDEITGDIVGGTTYYGWSRQFCEQMKGRKKKAKQPASERSSLSRSRSRSRSYSRGQSRSYSPPSFKRPRLSSRSRSRHRSRSRSRSRGRRGNDSNSRSRSRNQSSDRKHGGGNSTTSHRRRSYSRSRSPPAPSRYSNTNRPPPPQQPRMPTTSFPPVPPPNMGDFPIPPPPPPAGYQGHWPPPPPPPIPPSMAGVSMQGWMPNPAMMMSQMMGQWAGPPPPPHNNHFGRGNGGFRGRGRGGYDRGGYRGR